MKIETIYRLTASFDWEKEQDSKGVWKGDVTERAIYEICNKCGCDVVALGGWVHNYQIESTELANVEKAAKLISKAIKRWPDYTIYDEAI